MGAEYCEETITAKTPEEVKILFKETIEQCEYDYGHAGYSGTFAEKIDVDVLPDKPDGFWTREELYNKADDVNKWDNAIAGRISETEYLVCGWCSS
jgi:hypothetical protein